MASQSEHPGGLQETWDKFITDCQEIFPPSLTNPTDIASLQLELKHRAQGEGKEGRRACNHFMRALTCLAKAGEIVSQAAAIAFAPAQICGNAIVLVIDSVQKIRGAFADLATLAERMDAFLDVLRLHLEQSTSKHTLPELRNVCEKVLKQVLIILRLMYKLSSSKRERLKAAFKIFSDDDEIRDALSKLERMVEEFTQMEVAVILSKVSASARDLMQVHQGMTTLVSSNTLNVIEKALSLHNFGKVGEQNRYLHARLSNRAIPGTGQWLIRSSEFQDWKNGFSEDTVLTMVDVRGSGKTMITNRVICHLQEQRTPGLAYFYNSSTTTLSVLSWVLRCLIWQLVQVDAQYAQMVEATLATVDISTPLALWDHFLVKLPDSHEPRILIIDGLFGVEQRAADFIARMLRDVSAKGSGIRLFMTGQPGSTIHPINLALRASDLPRLHITRFAERNERRNAEDIEILVKHYLNNNIWTIEDQTLVATTMIDTLNSNNLFDDMLRSVMELNKCLTRDSLELKLDELDTKCREARIEAVSLRIAKVNKQLGPDQMKELNTILPWVIVAGGSCEAALLDEVLRLKSDSFEVISKRSITDRLDLYSALLGITGKRKRVHFWGNIDVFGHMQRRQFASTQEKPRAQGSKVPEHEVELMRNFLKTFCKLDMYEKFGFEDFFNSKLSISRSDGRSTGALVNIDRNGSQVEVLKTCLEALIKRKSDGTLRRLYRFAAEHLLDLLDRNVLIKANSNEEKEVTLLVARYVAKPYFPKIWRLDELPPRIDLERFCTAIQTWLSHFMNTDLVAEHDDRQFLEEFRMSEEPAKILLRRKESKAAEEQTEPQSEDEGTADGGGVSDDFEV